MPRLYELIGNGLKSKINASFITRAVYNLAALIKNRSLSQKIFKKVHDGLGGNLRFLVCGGAALPKPTGLLYQTLGLEVLEGYGMTEAAPLITFTRPGKVKVGSPGFSMPGLSVEIRDGEIVAKGDNIMQGYYNQPEETRAALRDGWLYTGDLGYFDKEGFLFITGRKKEMIVLPNGKNINPIELESKLEKEFETVREAGVFLYNKHLHAIILPDRDKLMELGIKDTEGYFRENVIAEFNKKQSSYKQIIQFTLTDTELPKTRLSKLQRFKLQELIEKSRTEKEATVFKVTEEYVALKNFIETQVEGKVLPHHHLTFDLALDSLGRLSLIDYIEQNFGITIEEEELTQFTSVRDLAAHIERDQKWFTQEEVNWEDALKEKSDVELPHTWLTHYLISETAKGFFNLYFRLKGKGMENIPEGPCIIAPNHQSFFDALFVTSFLKYKIRKKTFFYAKKKHVSNGFLQFLADHNNIVVMDINKGLKESIQKLAEVLRQGNNIIIFPEGTRSLNGRLGDFKKTFAILSTQLNVPVVPVTINGAYEALPQGSRFPKINAPITVEFRKPIYPQDCTNEELIREVWNAIHDKLKEKFQY